MITDDILHLEFQSWGAAKSVDWDLCVTLNVPNRLRVIENGLDDRWLEVELKKYFTDVDRAVFGPAQQRKGNHVLRWVGLEWAQGVEWHAHMLLKTPQSFSRDDYLQLLKLKWHKRRARFCTEDFKPFLFHAQVRKGDFSKYSIKNAFGRAYKDCGTFDAENSKLSLS
jgi:hypothetical protein